MLPLQGVNLYKCDDSSYCFDNNGLRYKYSQNDSANPPNYSWAIQPKSGGRSAKIGQHLGSVVGKVTGLPHRVWLNEGGESLNLEKFDLPSDSKLSATEKCTDARLNPSVAILFTGVDAKKREVNFNHSISFNWGETLTILKGEAKGIKDATWGFIDTLTKKETWKAIRQNVNGASVECFEKHDGNPVAWLGCIQIKFGKTIVLGIIDGVKQCTAETLGSSYTPEKAGECIGKVITLVTGTGVGVKGVQMAVKATQEATTVGGKLAGNAAQVATKCIGEVCGLGGATTELGMKTSTKAVASAAKAGTSVAVATNTEVKTSAKSTVRATPWTSKPVELGNGTENLVKRAETDTKLQKQLRIAGDANNEILRLPAVEAERVLKAIETLNPQELKIFKEEVKKPGWSWCP